ncbi:flippase [candidate division WWE3 bacterium]|nr:flippase [candidate division WWE3 bacterium]
MPKLPISNLTKTIGLNTIYQVFGRFITAITGLWITRLVISHMGVDGYGTYQIAINYVTIFWMLTDFGLNAVVVREMSANPEKENQLFGGLVTMRTVLSLIIMIISSAVLVFLPYAIELKMAILIGTISIMTQGIKGATHGLLQSRLRYDLQFYASFWGSLAFVIATYVVLLKYPGTIPLVIAFIIGQIIMMVISVWQAHNLSRFHFDWNKKQLKELSIATLPLGISLLFNLGNFKTDSFLLSVLPMAQFSNAQAVGMYNIAYKFFEFGLIVPTFFMNAVYPVMVKAHHESHKKFYSVAFKAWGVLFTVGVAGALLTWVLAPYVIRIVADTPDFGPAVTALRILMSAAPIFFSSSLLMWVLLTLNGQKKLMWIYAIAFVFNVSANLFLIPRYSFYGSAVVTGASEFIILLLLMITVYPTWKKDHTHSAHE